MDRLRAGDAAGLEELYDRHAAMLYAVALRVVRRAPDAEEVVQETFVHAWKRAAAWDSSRGTVAAWLLTIARSRAIDRYRSLASRRNAETAVMPDEPVHSDEPAAAAVRGQAHERVSAALGALEPHHRQTIELAYFGGLSQSEIATRLGAPLGTVKSWTRQALLRLRDLVPQEEWT